MKTWFIVLLMCAFAAQVRAQLPNAEPGEQAILSAQRAEMTMRKQAVMEEHTKLRKQCWQRFAVNDCLRDVRRAQRKALEPVQAELLALNARERALRLKEREQRLQDKAKP